MSVARPHSSSSTSTCNMHMRIVPLLLILNPPLAGTVALMFHKPGDLVVTHRDELGRRTVYDSLADWDGLPAELCGVRWHAIGRLDRETTGLLLFTNDGSLVRHCTDPTSDGPSVEKEYRAVVHKLDEEKLARLRAGVELSGGLGASAPAEVWVEAEHRTTTTIRLCLREGRNRQVRRMLHAVGSGVMQLHRARVGGLSLGELPEGSWRMLDQDEVRPDAPLAATGPRRARSAGARGVARASRGERRRAGLTSARARSTGRTPPGLPIEERHGARRLRQWQEGRSESREAREAPAARRAATSAGRGCGAPRRATGTAHAHHWPVGD